MKKGILFLLILGSFTAKAQKLKDLLYSGKLKADSNSVVRKTDDLSTKIDTSQKKKTDTVKTIVAVLPADSVKQVPLQTDSVAIAVEAKDSVTTDAASVTPAPVPPTPVKTNNKIWKEYTDSLMGSLKTEVLTSKKVKKETYYVLVEYELSTDGQVGIINVTAAPENTFLQDQIKERIISAPPQLNPVLDNNNQPRKVKRKYNFTITKE